MAALSDPEVKEAMDGNVVFFAVPSEEYGELEFKQDLMRQGKIRYGGGKQELIRTGAFRDISLSVVHHLSPAGIELGWAAGNGFVSKVIKIKGRAAHAAQHPELGVNALSAASLGLQALGLNRETFRDEDRVRVHPILTKGGDLVNVVPKEAVVETLVRASNLAAIEDASLKTDRSFAGAAFALGAGYEITTSPGYLPTLYQEAPEWFEEMVHETAPGRTYLRITPDMAKASSSDVGDLQHIMPVIGFRTGGMAGGLHQSDFAVTDESEAYLLTARLFALTAYRLLKNQAAFARKETEKYRPVFSSVDAYMKYMDRFSSVLENNTGKSEFTGMK